MSNYEKLLELKRNTRTDYFVIACSYLFDIGYQNTKEITDEEISKVEANGIMTKEFCEWLMKTARDIANIIDSAIELVQFCMVEDIFDIRLYANKLPRYKLEKMIKSRIEKEDIIRTDSADYIIYLRDRYECDAEDLELLGIEIPDSYWE